MSEKSNIKRASFSIEEEYQEKFKEISKATRRSMTDELRLMIDARAMALGIEPIAPVDPKSSAPRLEIAQ